MQRPTSSGSSPQTGGPLGVPVADSDPAAVPLPPGFSPEPWAPGYIERDLAAEIEKILKHKPSPSSMPAPSNVADVADIGRTTLIAPYPRVMALDDANNAGFDWTRDQDNATPDGIFPVNGAAASLQWLAKARAERRGRLMRNAFGWTTTLVIGGGILGGAAHLLTGWQPDFTALLALGQRVWAS